LSAAGLLLAGCGPNPTATARPSTSAGPSTTPLPTLPPGLPSGSLLPNLVMEPLDDWVIEQAEGRRRLRLTTIMDNVGVGPFELRGNRASLDEQTMAIDQLIYTGHGGFTRRPTEVLAQYAGDGHDHWHARGVVSMALSPLADPASVTAGDKIAFCFFDNLPSNPDLPGASSEPVYRITWCGTPEAYSVRMGLSVGWGDMYSWSFAFQWVDITGLPGGTYQLRATVDAANDYLELDESDNCTMSQIEIPATGEGKIVVVDASDQPC
jgi:hypothetical protein